MKFKFDPRTGRMVGSKTQILQRHEIERLGGVIPDNRHISPGTAYIPEKEVVHVKAAARRDGVEVTRLNDYDKNIGGGLYRFEKTLTFESEKEMKNLNESTKITLTIKQLKRLVKENIASEGTKTVQVKVTNVDWDVEEQDLIDSMKGDPEDPDQVQMEIDTVKRNLNKKLESDPYVEVEYCPGDDLNELVGDAISEKFGWLVNGVKFDMVDGAEAVNEEFDTEDGWDCDEIRDSGLMDTLRKCANLQYTLDKCTRASANFGETLGDLKAYVNELAEEMQNAVADFPDEDEEVDYPPEAMGDDEEIEVMEGKRDHVDFDADTLDFLAREYFRGLAKSKDVGSLQGFIKFVWGKHATPDDIEKATKAIAPYVMSPNVKIVDDDRVESENP